MTGTALKPRGARCVLACAGVLASVLVASASSEALKGQGHPFVTTGLVSHVRGTSVQLNGTVNPHGLTTTYYFIYGPTEAFGLQTPVQTLPAADERVKVGLMISGFEPGDYYRLVAHNADGYAPEPSRAPRYNKSSAPHFDIPKVLEAVKYMTGFTLTGKLVGQDVAKIGVALQETPYPYLEAFSTLGASTVTGAAGEFTFHVASLTSSGKFRVLALLPRPIYSRIVTQLVMPRVVLKVHRTKVKGLVRLFGTVTPAETGARILIQLEQARRPGNSEKASEKTSRFSTQFSTVARRATKTTSRFSVIVTIVRGGHYRAFVDLRKAALAPAGSTTVALSAPTGKHRSKH